MFQRAVKFESKLKLAIAGPSGSGKTYSGLALATHLVPDGKIAVVDTENRSAAKYSDLFTFDVLNMAAPFHPDRFVEAIQGAEYGGYDVLVLDSLSHAWNGSGGLLELVDQFAKRMKTANSFAAWKDATPIQNRLVEAINAANLHLICTMRSKQEYVLEQIERNGRSVTTPRKVGMAPIQRDGLEYEFDVYLDMDIDNNAIVAKTRCPALNGQVIAKPSQQLAKTLSEWLKGEAPPEPLRYGDGTAVNMRNDAEVEVFTSYQIQQGQVPASRDEARTFYRNGVPTV
ncbi:MAG: ATP-binding protein [Chloroflexota bacterium]